MTIDMVPEQNGRPDASRFVALWHRCLVKPSESSPSPPWDTLERYYGETHRHYHGFSHIAHCLAQHDLTADDMQEPDAVEMAIWFHDAVHEPRALDNEARSAELFRYLGSSGFQRSFVERVCGLILATIHDDPPLTHDQKFIVDIDLSSFGLPWDEYLRDTEFLRREQAGTPDALYHLVSLQFLKALARRPRIFHTDYFYQRYERVARENIERYRGILEASGSV